MKLLKEIKDIYWIVSIIIPLLVNNSGILSFPIVSLIISVVISLLYYFIKVKNKKEKEFIEIIDSLEVINCKNDCQNKFNSNRDKLSKRKGSNKLLTELIEYHEKINDDHAFNFNKLSTPNSNNPDINKINNDFEEYKEMIIDYKNKIKD